MCMKSKVLEGLEAFKSYGSETRSRLEPGPKLFRGRRGSDAQSRDISSSKKVTALYEVNKVVYAT